MATNASHPKPVRKAVIPAAGLGTRFLPFTKAVPKEMLPVVDQPVIQYVIEEAVEAGIEDILIVTSRGQEGRSRTTSTGWSSSRCRFSTPRARRPSWTQIRALSRPGPASISSARASRSASATPSAWERQPRG